MLSTNPVPLYHQILLVLREQIREGRFDAVGLPSEAALGSHYQVSRVTVRRALDELVREGLIERQRGRGTYPLPRRAINLRAARYTQRSDLSGLINNLLSVGEHTSVRVLEVRFVAATPEVAQALQIAEGESVQKAVRLRSTKAGTLSHITTFIPEAFARGIDAKALERKPVLALLEENGVQIGGAEQAIGACLADATVAALLEVAVGAPLLSVNRIIHNLAGRPVQYLRGLYRPDRYEYRMKLSRNGTQTTAHIH
jgi:GntR family transcriptional regulator